MANKAPNKTAFVAVALMRGESRKLTPAVTRSGELRRLEQKTVDNKRIIAYTVSTKGRVV